MAAPPERLSDATTRQHLGAVGLPVAISAMNSALMAMTAPDRRRVFEAFHQEGVHVFGDPCYDVCDGLNGCAQRRLREFEQNGAGSGS
jgi:hypothetical protein